MAYQRKTRDVWHILVNYGQGWEHELTEDTWKEAREQLKCYRENCPQYPIKAVHKRERIKEQTSPPALPKGAAHGVTYRGGY